ncbi:PREDICTED: dystrotelin [Mandrillus leucophaeus]|uniref:Dystrotelin n=1 Tax=Mandrillus leucophaeus TaxID=9568 RepID=A0A2K5ZW45_MANLE|nr:PREDICTED: dystrotelin [Mandrillus leucophaeus]
MDPDKQDALNSIENSIYRTAFKLRSVQTLCQLDLIDSSLIQQVLLRPSFWEARKRSLSVQQLSQALQELFQKAREENPGQVHPRAPELTLSLLTTMCNSTGTDFLQLMPAAAALITLSGDSPLTKYRALFQLYAENSRGGYDSGPRMTRRVLRKLLTDLQQIPTVVGESRALCPVESATRSCFQGVLSPAIKEEKFLSWVQSEPPILLWLPTCHRLSAAERVTHPARCTICRTFPITGLRYRCLKCLNFDICQMCFLSGLHSKSHQKSHPVIEHCVQMSAMQNTKLLFRTLRNNLLQGRCRKKEAARRQRLLDQVNPKGVPHHAQARLLKKQLNQYKDKLQAIYTSQEERSCRFETKIYKLKTNQDSLWSKLQQIRRDLQVRLQPPRPSSSSFQSVGTKVGHSSTEKVPKGGDYLQIKNATEDASRWEPLPNPDEVDRSHRSHTNAEHVLRNSESPETTLHSTTAQSQTQKMLRKVISALPSCQEGLKQDTPKMIPAERSSPALATTEKKAAGNIKERKDELEEEELQELLSKLMDAFNLEMPSGPESSVNMDLYSGAQQVCRAFSALVDQITLPILK